MTEPDFRKTYFSGRKCRKYAGKTGFLAISRDFIISFFQFFAQRCILVMLITWPSPIFDKFFFSGRKYRKYAGNCRFCRFSLDFFHIFCCSFSHKSLNDIVFTFVRSLARSLARSFVRSFVRSFTRSFAALFRTFISR